MIEIGLNLTIAICRRKSDDVVVDKGRLLREDG